MPSNKQIKLEWSEVQRLPTGSRFWLSKCERFKIICSEEYDGIKMPKLYNCWALTYFKGVEKASWFKFAECGSQKKAIKLCNERRFKE